MNDEHPLSLVGTTPSDSTTEEVHEFEHDGVVTHAKVVTHKGQQYALRQNAQLIRDGSRTSLWQALDAEYLAGNGQVYDLPVRFEFTEGDRIVLSAENINTDGYEYHHNMAISIDYETTGLERAASKLGGLF